MDHFYQRISGWFDYSSIYRRMVELAPPQAHFVEIGTYMGCSAAFLAVEIINSGKDIKLSCVDSETRYKENLECVMHMIDVITIGSPAAAAGFADESVDFIWIDGDHDEQAFRDDVQHWLPKLRQDGYLGGHDYDHPAHPGIREVCRLLLPGHAVIPADEPGGMVSSFLWQKPKLAD